MLADFIHSKVCKLICEIFLTLPKGELDIDNYSEKKHDWVFFEKLMLAAWLRIFEPQNETALEVAYQWAQIVEKAFASGSYSVADDIAAFTQ